MESLRSDLFEGSPPARMSWLLAVFWWLITLGTLVVLDDLTFGPAFWLLARWRGSAAAAATAFVIYYFAQIYLVRRGTDPEPGSVATFFLQRLSLERRSREVADRERAVHAKVAGVTSSIALSPVMGGVLPPLLLYRRGYERSLVRRLSYATAFVYAVEFSFLHGWSPGRLAH
ncbi:MAG: hypothetical protein KDA37_15495 [Planctomycetales bacterium]|nr:hypothetical protein [Planctomycetales bacterium]